jgi:hypothetical protein
VVINKKRFFIIVAVVLLASATILYFFVNPENSELMPKCVVKQLTGYDCPSCGAQRAFHAVLHGDFIKALSYNPFFIISVPYFLLVLYATIFKNASAQKIRRIAFHRYALYAYVVLFFAWWVARNIWF